MKTSNRSSVFSEAWKIACAGLLLLAAVAGGAESVTSPDGKIVVAVELQAGRPLWSVACGDNKIIRDGLLGVDSFCGTYKLLGKETAAGDVTWKPVWGFVSTVRDHFNELTLKLEETVTARRQLHIVVRAYDEGVAVRYVFPPQPGLKEVTVKKLLTEFTFDGDKTIYSARDYQYGNATIASLKKSEGSVTVALGGGPFVSLTDADCADFSVVSWCNRKDLPNTLIGVLHSPASGALPFKTSWQAMVIGETAGKLVENRFLIENLNPPCAIADTSWIKPGKAICQVYNCRMVTDEIKKLMDFGSAHGFDYLEIDHSWSGAETKWTPAEIANFEQHMGSFWKEHPEWRENVKGGLLKAAKGYVPFRPNSFTGGNYVDLDIPALTAYGKSLKHPIGLCLYVRGALLKEFGGEHAIEDVFACYEKWGVAGVKPGFVPPASQQNERAIAYMVKKAAEHKLIAVIHDAVLPHGLCRTYPNLVNIEGVAGEEAEPSIAPPIKALHDIMLPFTRGIMGSFDYTPQIFKASKTHCHQVAMLGIYPGRASVRAGMKQWSPGGEGGAEIEFAEKLPGLTDELKVFGEPGKWVTFARRKGTSWYVAGMSGPAAVQTALPLSFLKPGVTYTASIYSDIPGQRAARHTTQQVNAATVLPLALEPNGGHLLIVEAAAGASQQAPAPARKIDPCFAQIADDPKLPRVLLIGDSVSCGYTLAVRKELAGQANLHRPPANCGSTKTGLRDLEKWLGSNKWDVIHFNWGLHDLGYRFTENDNRDAQGNYARPDNGGHQNVTPAQYEQNLRELIARLKRTGAKLICATTTPVPADLHSYVKAAELPYNVAAKKVMSAEGVPVADLWAFATPQLDKIQEHGNPHFTAKGSEALAREVARHITAALENK